MTFELGDQALPSSNALRIQSDRKRPGGLLADHHMYEPRLFRSGSDWIEAGVRTPEGMYFPFNNGERLVLLRDGTGRKPMIRIRDGNEVAFPAWRKARQDENVKSFKRIHPQYLTLYMNLLTEYPELEQIDVVIASSSENPTLGKSIGRFDYTLEDKANPFILLNQKAEEMVVVMDEVSIREIAKVIGIDPAVLTNNPLILQTFVFLHEFGHAYDFIAHYLNSPFAKTELYDPAEAMRRQSKFELSTMLIPGISPSRLIRLQEEGKFDLERYFKIHRLHYFAKGIRSWKQLLEAVQVNYRKLPKEKFADNFAADVMRNNWKRLGLDKIT